MGAGEDEVGRPIRRTVGQLDDGDVRVNHQDHGIVCVVHVAEDGDVGAVILGRVAIGNGGVRHGGEHAGVRRQQHVGCPRGNRAGNRPDHALDVVRDHDIHQVGHPRVDDLIGVNDRTPRQDKLDVPISCITRGLGQNQAGPQGKPEVVARIHQAASHAKVRNLQVVRRELRPAWQCPCVGIEHEDAHGRDQERVFAIRVGRTCGDREVTCVDDAVGVHVAVEANDPTGLADIRPVEGAVLVRVEEDGSRDQVRVAGQAVEAFVVGAQRQRPRVRRHSGRLVDGEERVDSGLIVEVALAEELPAGAHADLGGVGAGRQKVVGAHDRSGSRIGINGDQPAAVP